MIVQHYVEAIGERDHLRLVSDSDVFTLTGRTKIGVNGTCASRRSMKRPVSSRIPCAVRRRPSSSTSSAGREFR